MTHAAATRRSITGPLGAWVAVLALLALALLEGCAVAPWPGFPTAINPARVWPPPPETARVAWVAQIRSRDDLFGPAGMWESIKTIVGGARDTSLVRPFALAVHPAGGLLVADPGRKLVHFFDWSRRRYVAIGEGLPGGLPSPVGVAALPDGRILVSDSRRVERPGMRITDEYENIHDDTG
ncbi:MAG: hypothetical protein M1457_12110, partial [bacterium]|nr:hypothetical protein [bacterium]